MVLMVKRLSLRFLLKVDRLLSHRFIRMKGYAHRRILGPIGHRPTTCTTLVNIEYKGNMQMQVPMVTVSYFKYVRMQLFSYNMAS